MPVIQEMFCIIWFIGSISVFTCVLSISYINWSVSLSNLLHSVHVNWYTPFLLYGLCVLLLLQYVSYIMSYGKGNSDVERLKQFCNVSGLFSLISKFCPFFPLYVRLSFLFIISLSVWGVRTIVALVQYMVYDALFFLFTMCICDVCFVSDTSRLWT
jgi:hypothetical protein